MQVYNNMPMPSVWKNYTANAQHLRESISKLSNNAKAVQDNIKSGPESSGGEISMSQTLRYKYMEAAKEAGAVESRINSYQAADAWMNKAQTILGEFSDLIEAQSVDEGDSAANVEFHARIELMQSELSRINQKDQGSFLTTRIEGAGSAVDAASGGSRSDWIGLVCSESIDVGSEEGKAQALLAARTGIESLTANRMALNEAIKAQEVTLADCRSRAANIRATQNRIQDPELAFESAESAKGATITQVGTAMLAQANTTPGTVINLVATAAGGL
jgi:flagellin